MTPRVLIGNASSRLEAPRDVVDRVRWLVAYRGEVLPPRQTQALIKRVIGERRRYGYDRDVAWVYSDPSRAATLEADGWPLERMTRRVFERVLAQHGCWDGWVPMVDPQGAFGTGLVAHVQRALELRMGLRVELVDERRPCPSAGPVGRCPPLFPFQEEAAAAWLAAERGVIDLPPRSGKTRIAARVIGQLGLPTLYVTPQRGLVDQTVRALRAWLPRDQVVAVVGAQSAREQRSLSRAMVWVCTPQTAAGAAVREGARRSGMEGIATRRVLVIDEFHHAAAAMYQDVSLAAREARWRLGLTGTHFRADGRDLEMRAVLADAVYSRTVPDMVAAGRLVPARVAMVRVPGPRLDAKGRELVEEGVVSHPARNDVLAYAARILAARGKRVLVLVKEVDHAKALAARIRSQEPYPAPRTVQVDGSDGEAVERALADLEAGRVPVVVGTSVIGEGRDVPAADALVYGCGGSSRVKVTQDTYRVLTAHPGKRWGIIVDAADNHHPGLVEAAAERLALYREQFEATVMDPERLGEWVAAV